MPKKRFMPEEIVAKLRQVDVLTAQGRPLDEAVKTIRVTETAYHRWRNEYGGLKLDQVKRLNGSADLRDLRPRFSRTRSNSCFWRSATPASIGDDRVNGPRQWGNLRSCSRIAFRPQRTEAEKLSPTASLTQTVGQTPVARRSIQFFDGILSIRVLVRCLCKDATSRKWPHECCERLPHHPLGIA